MIITISGKPGAGKSTVARLVAKKLKLKHYSAGSFMREMARKRKMSLIEFSKLAERDKSIDREIDERNKRLAKKDNLVIDTRLGFYFIPQSIKIFLDVDLDEGARRIFETKRKEESYEDFSQLLKEVERRVKSERTRLEKYYGVKIYDFSNYDLVIDTTEISAEEAADKIIEFVKRFKKK